MFNANFKRFVSTVADAVKDNTRKSIVGQGAEFFRFALLKDNLAFTGALITVGACIASNIYLENKVDEGFRRLDEKVEQIEVKMEKIDVKMEAKMEKLEAKMEQGFRELRGDLKTMIMLFAVGRIADTREKTKKPADAE